ncbi:MAG TPA: hypothetical protein VFV50_11220 [Bdellovibrionales bacterium]|nr:hypothetical protein [Bdellovibrionales bacterium]
MYRLKVLTILLLLSTMVMLPYTNCSNSNVAFDQLGQPILDRPQEGAPALLPAPANQPAPGSLTGPGDVSVPGETSLSPEEREQMTDRTPPEDLSAPVPVSELHDNPVLFETYACPNGRGVVICHVSSTATGGNSLCVAASAALAHAGHIRTNYVNGAPNAVSDYLGACRD